MGVSVSRSLTAALGACAVTAALAVTPLPPAQPAAATVVQCPPAVRLLAAVQPLDAGPGPAVTAAAPVAAAVTLSPAGDFVINAWNTVVPWIDYGVELAQYVLQFLPFGYLLGAQIDIFWYSLIEPVANSFVVDLVAPVVSAPLDLSAWVNGITSVATTTVVSLVNLGISELAYFFGWLIPPLPPISLPLAAATATDPPAEPVTEPVVSARVGVTAADEATDDAQTLDDAATLDAAPAELPADEPPATDEPEKQPEVEPEVDDGDVADVEDVEADVENDVDLETDGQAEQQPEDAGDVGDDGQQPADQADQDDATTPGQPTAPEPAGTDANTNTDNAGGDTTAQ